LAGNASGRGRGLMIRLRTLGTLDLRGPDGAELRSVLAQPKRLALLAYLAVATPNGFHRRDTLVALFWPELDHEHARAALRKALHGLRHELGDGVVVTRGDEDVMLAPDGAWCDGPAFEQLLAEGRRVEALDLYRGDLLAGLYISGAPEFERWLEGERTRFRRQAAAAAWAHASDTEARGEDMTALQSARRALLLSPDDEGAVRRMIGLLDRVGDRAGALHVYDEFARQLSEDYAAEPSVETKTLIDAVRQRVRRISGERPARRPPAPPPEAVTMTVGPAPGRRRPWRGLAIAAVAAIASIWGAAQLLPSKSRPVIAVGSIRDFSSADTSAVGRALPQLLATNLARLPAIQVISGARLYEIQGQLDAGSAAPRSPTVTSAAARRAGATELLEGELYRLPEGGLRLDLRRTRLTDGQVIGSYTSEGDDAFELVDAITSEVALAAGLPASGLHVADVTTSSLTAYQLYETGLWAYYRVGDRNTAHRLFLAALAEDSGFAMAAYYTAMTNRWGDDWEANLQRATRLANRATDRERLLILGTWGVGWPGIDPLAAAETLAARYPAEPDGDLLLADGLIWLRGDYSEAIKHLRRVVTMDSLALAAHGARCLACDALDLMNQAFAAADSPAARLRVSHEWVQLQPQSLRARGALAATFRDLGHYDEARAAFDTIVRLRGASVWDTLFRATIQIREGEFESVDRALHELLRVGDPGLKAQSRWYLASSLREQGRAREAITVSRELHRSDPKHWEYQAQEAMALLELGRPRETAALFESLARSQTHISQAMVARLSAWLLTHAATALAAAHDTAALAAVADSIDALASRVGPARDRYFPSYARGLILAARGHQPEAAAMFRAALRSPTLGYTRVNLELGRLELQSGHPREAIDVLQPPLRGGGDVEAATYVTHTELHLWIARAFDAAGQPDSAAVHYRWVLKAWKSADPEFAAQRDSVRARLTALGRT
jgi:DNA-binding SARP family transcriptional activator/tetratricopeptide (TPR) repeat protein